MNTSIGNTPSGRPGELSDSDRADKQSETDFEESTRTDPSQAKGGKEEKSGKTETSVNGGARPRLPHERDESSDSQEGVRPVIERARADVESGRVDTDRGTPAHDAYQRQKRQGPTSTQS